MAHSPKKTEQVVLFFLEHINHVRLGRTKLMKLLYYVDFDHYEKCGRSVTGAEYHKLPHGLVPKQTQKLISEMVQKGLVRETKVKVLDYDQHRVITQKTKFDPSFFPGDELRTLEKVAADWEDANATKIEAASHVEAPWVATEDGKRINSELAYYRHPVGTEPLDDAFAKSKNSRSTLPPCVDLLR